MLLDLPHTQGNEIYLRTGRSLQIVSQHYLPSLESTGAEAYLASGTLRLLRAALESTDIIVCVKLLRNRFTTSPATLGDLRLRITDTRKHISTYLRTGRSLGICVSDTTVKKMWTAYLASRTFRLLRNANGQTDVSLNRLTATPAALDNDIRVKKWTASGNLEPTSTPPAS
jgi:hypothetical protein